MGCATQSLMQWHNRRAAKDDGERGPWRAALGAGRGACDWLGSAARWDVLCLLGVGMRQAARAHDCWDSLRWRGGSCAGVQREGDTDSGDAGEQISRCPGAWRVPGE
ncbi:hypothetical protein AcV7_007299 [Taiwanofungus camphoratus]|nr:hypothetical protein AcV7_007299 [Antrodia cinnamomea]